jgi:hypothetical protein
MHKLISITTAAALAAAFTQLAAGATTATFALHAQIPWQGSDAPCPDGFSPTVGCHPHPGGPVAVPGLGFVSQSYLYPVETEPGPSCVGGGFVLGYTARLSVTGKGEIYLLLGPVDGCLYGPPQETVLTPTQPFSITGGSEVYTGASGSGVVSRTSAHRTTAGHGAATDIWDGTLVVQGLEFDLTPPEISGAVDKVVRAPRKAKRVRVKFNVTAADAVDGPIAVDCKPRSGSFFRVGRRTTVTCSATDSSANTSRATLAVLVKRHT